MKNQTAALDTHPDRRTRKQHLQVISYYKKIGAYPEATRYWLMHSQRISKQAFNNA